MDQLAQITDFIRSIEVLKTTVRHNRFPNGRQESVAEHTWRMALFFITVQESLHLEVDVLKIIKMILVHDIPEGLDGDVPNLPEYQSAHDIKLDKELLAARYYFDRLPSPLNQEFYDLFVEFEARQTYDAKVAKVFDHLEWLYQHIATPVDTWSESEKGDFAFQYTVSSIQDLDDPRITQIWKEGVRQLKQIQDQQGYQYNKEYVDQLLAL